MTNPFSPLAFDPATSRRAGRTLRKLPEAERPRERLALRGAGGLSRGRAHRPSSGARAGGA